MATVITGDMDMIDAMVHGTISRAPAEYLQQAQQQFLQNVIPAAHGFFEKAWDLQNRMANNRAMYAARGAARKMQSLWQHDAIRTLVTIGEFQNAPQTMRRFIMAQPTVQKMWRNQELDGYGEEFEAEEIIPIEDTLEYRQVMDGEMVETPEDDEFAYEFVCYHSDELEFDKSLILSDIEQHTIRESWRHLEDLILYGDEDPTSETNEPI